MTIIARSSLALFLTVFMLSNPAQAGRDTSNPDSLTPITLQLKWKHQFQFAGYYAAIRQGYYRDAGLNVTLKEAGIGQGPIQSVLSGQAQFGVGTSEVLLNFYENSPIVVLAVIMQHSPLTLAALSDSGIENIHQLASHPIMMEPNSLELMAYLKAEGVKLDKLQLRDHRHRIDELIDGQVGSMSVYTTDELFDFKQKGLDVQLFRPVMSGIDFYGDNLFTTKKMVEESPKIVADFLQASLKGWQYAMQHPDEIIDLILSQYSTRKSRAHLEYEAERMRQLMMPDLVEIGYMNPGRWQHIAYTYHQLGILPKKFDVQGMLYEPIDLDYEHLKQQLYYAVAILVLLSLLAAIVYRQFHRTNVRRQQFEDLFQNAPVSLIEIDQQGLIHHWNREAENTFQYSAKEAIQRNVYDLLLPKPQNPSIPDIIQRTLAEKVLTFSENENIRKDGQRILCKWSNMPFETGHKHHKHLICMAQDITQQKEMQTQLYRAAHYDGLTGLPNRTLILEQLKHTLDTTIADQNYMAILFIDLNDFKIINDTHGHPVGDVVLKHIAERLQCSIGEHDQVGRLSGDEFLIIIPPSATPPDLKPIMTAIHTNLKPSFQVEDLTLTLSASIGCSVFPEDANDMQHLIAVADQAMYREKLRKRTV
jgi:diguanylate cyclase (GGDEF)-like protein/PAS domain S-box-containing protein